MRASTNDAMPFIISTVYLVSKINRALVVLWKFAVIESDRFIFNGILTDTSFLISPVVETLSINFYKRRFLS